MHLIRQSAGATITMFDNNSARTSGSNSLQVNPGGTGNASHIMVGIKPAGGSTTNSNFFALM